MLSTSSLGTRVASDNVGGRSAGHERDASGHDQQRRREPCRNAPDRVQTLHDFKAEQIQQDAQPQAAQHEAGRVDAAVRKTRRAGTTDQQRIRRDEQQERGKVEEIVDPDAPAAHEAVHGSEGAARPPVEPAFLGKTARQLDHGQRHRQEEQEPRQNPQGDRWRARPRAPRDPPQADHRHDVHRDDVPHAEHAFEMLHVVGAAS